MAETNKILEVTYGEFSCRLEGFEDSVETMKAVVAYFHELGGRENFREMRAQAPDAATLALLTEEQTGGTVEVENTGAGVSLRFHGNPADEDTASEDGFDADTSEETATWDDASDAEADVATEGDATLRTDDMEEAASASGDAPAEDDDEPVAADHSDGEDLEISDEPAPAMSDDTAPASTETSVTDRLQRIRAVVGRGNPQSSDGYVEDVADPDQTDKPKAVNPLAQRLAELAKRNADIMSSDKSAQRPEIDGSSPDEEATQAEDMVDAADVRAALATDEDDAEAQPFEDTAEEDIAEAEQDQEFADKADVEGNVVAAEDADTRLEDDPAETANEDTLEAVGHEGADEAQDATDEFDEDDTEEVAQVDEVARDDAAVGAGDDDAPEDIAETDDEHAQPTESRPLLLTSRHSAILGQNDDDDDEDDDEFDLKAELAAIEREIAARPNNGVARHGLPRSVEDAMSRILNETNEHLNEPESRRHRDAFAQLKAAVAATEASRQLGDLAKSRDISAQFRDDLGALDAEDKAKGESLPPLKLVTPIRDDNEAKTENASDPDAAPRSPKPLDAASNRLQQIAAKVASGDGADQTSFAAFAQEQGAHELADMLEAAAAYISYVEGDDDFSRPQVMKVVQSASDAEISREDGLRSFGRLLRQSRIVKLNNGRFQISENSRFRPETGRAARG